MAAGAAETDVANKALIELGEIGQITALTDDDERARTLLAVFGIARRAVLREHFWSFALKQASVAADSTTPTFDFSNRYRLPSDFIALVRMYPREVNWKRVGDYLYSDYGPPLEFTYVRDEDNLGVWDALATDLLATRLAMDAAYAITGTRDLRRELMQVYATKLSAARHMDAMESGSTEELDIDVWGRSREHWIAG